MAAETPGWCKRCGESVEPNKRTNGRAREFCGDTCRQAFGRAVRLRRDLHVEVGLTDKQVERLLDLFKVTKRDARTSRSESSKGARA